MKLSSPQQGSNAVLTCCSAVKHKSAPQPRSSRSVDSVRAAKESLKAAISSTNRGGAASSSQRGWIEEAQVGLEALSEGIDYDKLPGKWRIVFTNAPDVAPLLTSERVGLFPLQVGNIYQEFSAIALGEVKNIIQLSIPFLLEKGEGVTVTVKADYSVRSPSRIALTFREAGLGNIRISPQIEALLAPAALPRGWLNHRLLLAIREFHFSIPLRRQLPTALQNGADRLARNVGSEYLLTYLDDDTLIGRQTGPGGTFIFERDN